MNWVDCHIGKIERLENEIETLLEFGVKNQIFSQISLWIFKFEYQLI